VKIIWAWRRGHAAPLQLFPRRRR